MRQAKPRVVIATAPPGVPLHTREFAEYAGGPTGEAALGVVARTLAGVALDLFQDPQLGRSAWAELREMRETGKDSQPL